MPEHFFRKLMPPKAEQTRGFGQEDRAGLAQFLAGMIQDPETQIVMRDTAALTDYVISSRDKSFRATITINKHPINVSLKKK